MIRATFSRNRQGQLVSFRLEGHARGWRPWPDPICAGVSAIAQTVIGSLQDLAGLQPDYRLQPGLITCSVDYPEDADGAEAAATLMEAARIGCLQIEDSYGSRYVTVIDQTLTDNKGGNHD